jgi:hypothetical protein
VIEFCSGLKLRAVLKNHECISPRSKHFHAYHCGDNFAGNGESDLDEWLSAGEDSSSKDNDNDGAYWESSGATPVAHGQAQAVRDFDI